MSALADYYSAKANEANAAAALAQQQGGLIGRQTSEVGANAAADRFRTTSQGQSSLADAVRNIEEGRQIAPNAEVARRHTGAQTAQIGSETVGQNIKNTYLPASLRTGLRSTEATTRYNSALTQEHGLFSNTPDEGLTRQPDPYGTEPEQFNMGTEDTSMYNYDHGEEMVPGEGDGSEDTVHSMLAPGEAVINKGGADVPGVRDLVRFLNDLGAKHMAAAGHAPDGMKGMPARDAKPGSAKTPNGKPVGAAMGDEKMTPGYVTGTQQVPQGPATQSDIAAGMNSPLAASGGPRPGYQAPSGGQQLVNQFRGNGRAMGDEDVQNYSMGIEYVPYPAKGDNMAQGTTQFAEDANLSDTGMQGGGKRTPGKGMPKYAKGTSKVGKKTRSDSGGVGGKNIVTTPTKAANAQ